MTAPWLTIIGIGDDGILGLGEVAKQALAEAEIILGGKRHLALIPEDERERQEWLSPFSANVERLKSFRGRNVCVLASGDPIWFGPATTFARHIPIAEMRILPHHGAFSVTAARLGWALQDCHCLSAHGRPAESIALHLYDGAKLLILSQNGQTPETIAAILRERGFGASQITVFEHLEGAAEQSLTAPADIWDAETADLNTIAVAVRADPGKRGLPLLAGLPDDAFEHDGKMTKREVRAVTLASLAPLPGETLWDIGAGCGSVAIEWARAGGKAIAIEPDTARHSVILRNAAILGVPNLRLIGGEAPDILPEIEDAPDAIFIGGGLSVPGLIEACWQCLPSGGRLAANAVTTEGEAALLAFHAQHGGALTRLAVSRVKPVGAMHGWQALMPVTHYLVWKE